MMYEIAGMVVASLLKKEHPLLKLSTYAKASADKLGFVNGLRHGKRRGKPVTTKDYFYYFLLFLDEKKQKSPT